MRILQEDKSWRLNRYRASFLASNLIQLQRYRKQQKLWVQWATDLTFCTNRLEYHNLEQAERDSTIATLIDSDLNTFSNFVIFWFNVFALFLFFRYEIESVLYD